MNGWGSAVDALRLWVVFAFDMRFDSIRPPIRLRVCVCQLKRPTNGNTTMNKSEGTNAINTTGMVPKTSGQAQAKASEAKKVARHDRLI